MKNIQHKYKLAGGPAAEHLLTWPLDALKYDLYISEEGLYELLFSSQQPLAKTFRKHCCNVMFPHIRQQLMNKMKEAIEEKDCQPALFNNELQAIQYENVGLQGEIRAHGVQI